MVVNYYDEHQIIATQNDYNENLYYTGFHFEDNSAAVVEDSAKTMALADKFPFQSGQTYHGFLPNQNNQINWRNGVSNQLVGRTYQANGTQTNDLLNQLYKFDWNKINNNRIATSYKRLVAFDWNIDNNAFIKVDFEVPRQHFLFIPFQFKFTFNLRFFSSNTTLYFPIRFYNTKNDEFVSQLQVNLANGFVKNV